MAVKAGAHFPQAGVCRQKIASRYGNLHSAGAGWAAWAWHTAVCGLEAGEEGCPCVPQPHQLEAQYSKQSKTSMISEAAH